MLWDCIGKGGIGKSVDLLFASLGSGLKGPVKCSKRLLTAHHRDDFVYGKLSTTIECHIYCMDT
jgi:hypothetical protein